jgi:3-oxoacyl-[acyl-carrier-protein] synthase I
MGQHAPAEILAIGMVTPVGLCTAQTAASVRTGIGRINETELSDGAGNPLFMGLADEAQLPPLAETLEDRSFSIRQERAIRLAGTALREALASRPDEPPPALHLGLPEPRTEARSRISDELLDLLPVQAGQRLDLARSKTYPFGRAAGLVAMDQALAVLDKGQAKTVLAGAVDCHWDDGLLDALGREGRLKTGEISDGFVPGEGAAFILLGPARTRGKTGSPCIVATGRGTESGHLYSDAPYLGEGLAGAIRDVLQATPPDLLRRPIGCVYGGLNGESHWAKGWGVSHIRNARFFAEGLRTEHPADCMGDPGAALGLIMVGLAAHRQGRDLDPGPTLVWCASDRGECAAAVVAR